MDKPSSFDPNNQNPEGASPAETTNHETKKSAVNDKPFNFWRGLQTALGAAFIVATLFTVWTPGSLVESGFEARMAQVIEAASQEGALVPENSTDVEEEEASNRIGIVAGHYGSDSGAVCDSGLTEVEMNLKIATLVQKSLSDLGYQVDLLEEYDDRLHGYLAAVLVSIHLDSCVYINDQATGFKVATALSEQNVVAGQRLTTCISARYAEVTGLPYHAGSVTNDMTFYHAFDEIDQRTIAAIIEAGFLNMDNRFITEDTDRIAEGIVAGILCYMNNEIIRPTQSP
jgi:N-acetylmuramoyl-L-alanine amidase